MENQELIDRLIARWIQGECTPEEAEKLFMWAEKSRENKRYMEDVIEIFRASSVREPDFDPGKAWESFQGEINEKDKPGRGWYQLAAAASVLIILALGFFFFLQKEPNLTATLQNSLQQSAPDTLPDGTSVMLGSGTSVRYIESSGERTAILEGTAFFTVSPSDKQFIVKAGDLVIRDIGTAFDVVSMPNGIQVMVSEGIVELTAGENRLVIHAGQAARFEDSVLTRIDSAYNTGMSSWRTKEFTFKTTSLAEVIRELNLAYGNLYALEDTSAGSCEVSVSFREEDPEMIADVIAATLGMEVEKRGTGYLLIGNCN